jgi:hypothetical protein
MIGQLGIGLPLPSVTTPETMPAGTHGAGRVGSCRLVQLWLARRIEVLRLLRMDEPYADNRLRRSRRGPPSAGGGGED